MSKEKVSAAQALRLIGYIRDFYKAQGLGEIGHVNLHVLSDLEMALLFGECVEGNACTNGTINMLRNVPPSRFCEIFAHELLHVWQFEHGYFNIDPPIYEGFCNLGSYLFLQSVGTPGCRLAMANMLLNPDPVYGEGLQRMLEVYRRSGWQGCISVLDHLK